MRRLAALGLLGWLLSPLTGNAGSLGANSCRLPQEDRSPPGTENKNSQQTQSAVAVLSRSDILRNFQTYTVSSKTVFLDPELLKSALENRPEFEKWNLVARAGAGQADVSIEVSLPPLSWEWNYRLLESSSGRLLAAGKVHALEAREASKLMAAEIAEMIGTAREKPKGELEEVRTATSSTASVKEWRMKGGSGSFFGEEVTVRVSADCITVTEVNNKEHSVTIPTQTITAVYPINLENHGRRDRVHAYDRFWDDLLGSVPEKMGEGADMLAPVFIPPLLIREGIVLAGPWPRRLVAIRWERVNRTYALAFESELADVVGLFRDLRRVAPVGTTYPAASFLPLSSDTPGPAADIPRGKALEITLDQAVTASLGPWPALEPGVYQLEIVERQNAPTQVHFYQRESNQFLALRAVAFVQLQRGLPSVVSPVVTVREKDGTLMLDEIRVSTILLHFD